MNRAKKKILCVEDDEDTCVLITTLLDEYEIMGAYSQADALKRATDQQFDLYLLDYHLPDGTGLELCLLIRVFDKHTPILFCMGTASLTKKQIHTAGAQGLVRKGTDFVETLEKAIQAIFEGKKMSV